MSREAIQFADKQDLLDWIQRCFPDDAQFLAPAIRGYEAHAASKRVPAPRLEVDLIIPTDALGEHSPASSIQWLVGPKGRVQAIVTIIVAQADTFAALDAEMVNA